MIWLEIDTQNNHPPSNLQARHLSLALLGDGAVRVRVDHIGSEPRFAIIPTSMLEQLIRKFVEAEVGA